MNKPMLQTLALTLAAVAAVASLGACKHKDKSAAKLPPPSGAGAAPLPEIEAIKAAAHAATGDALAPGAVVAGTLQARSEVAVAPRGSGTILLVAVDEGSRVKKGALLFQLDSRDAQLMKKQAMNQLAGAELQLRTAQREYDRMKGLVGQNAFPQQQLDTLEAQVDGAKLQIVAAQTSIAMASKAINDAAARSPLTGVVIKKLMSAGEYATMMPPSPVVIVQDQTLLDLKFRLAESALSSVKTGDPVTLTVPSLAQIRAATIAMISPMVDPRTRTIELTATVDNCDGGLRPGLAAEVALGAPTGAVTAPDCGKRARSAP